MTPEIHAKVALLRQRAQEGTMTEQDMAETVILLRQGRVGAQIASDTSRRKKAIAAIPDADDLLSELMGE